jgi:putative PEP-CTERM system TPR-repeat lipoprotein
MTKRSLCRPAEPVRIDRPATLRKVRPLMPKTPAHQISRQHRFAGLLVLFAALGLSACHRSEQLTPQEYVARARQSIAAQKFQSAEVDLKSALQKEPKNAEARLLLATAYIGLKRGQDAESAIGNAEQFGAKPSETLLLRAKAYVLQREYPQVLKAIPAQIVGDPDRVADLTEVRADAQLALGLSKEAEASYDAVLKVHPKSLDSLFGKTRIDTGRGDLAGAMRQIDAALTIDPKSTIGLLLKGDLLLANKDSDGAIKSYQAAVDSAPDDEGARVAVASALIGAGKFDAAREQLAAVQKKSPNNPQANYLAALLEYRQGRNKEAFDAVQKVTAALPDYPPAVILTASIQYALGSLLQAETNAQAYLKAYPNSLYARKLLAAIYMKGKQPAKAFDVLQPVLGQPDLKDGQVYALAGSALGQLNQSAKALEYLAKAATLDPKDASIQTTYGANSLASGDIDRAINAFESVAKIDTGNSDAESLLIVSYMGKKEYQKAIDGAQALIKRDPKNPAFYNLLGGAYQAQQNLKAARENFERALAQNPGFAPAAINLAQMDLAAKQPADAKKHLTDALAHNDKDPDLLVRLADIELNEGHADAGTQWLETAVKRNPDLLGPKLLLARYLLQTHKPQRALAITSEAESGNSSNAELLALLAQSQADTGDRDAAVATYGRLAGLQPDAPRIQVEIARLEAADAHWGAAQAALAKALAMSPGFADADIALAEIDTQTGKFDEAGRIASELAKRPDTLIAAQIINGNIAMGQRRYDVAAKDYGDAYAAAKTVIVATKLHNALLHANRKGEADTLMTQWMNQYKRDPISRLYMASQAELAGDGKRAEDLYQQVLQIEPTNAIALNELALIYYAAKDSRALDYAERAYAQQPGNSAIGDTLGWILVDSGNVARGRPILEKVVKTTPDDSGARYHLAVALFKSGEKATARSNLQLALKGTDAFPGKEDARKLLNEL